MGKQESFWVFPVVLKYIQSALSKAIFTHGFLKLHVCNNRLKVKHFKDMFLDQTCNSNYVLMCINFCY